MLKSNYDKKNLMKFYKYHLSNEYAQQKSCTHELISVFGDIYLCEKIFSKTKCILYKILQININKKICKLILFIGKTAFEL